MATKHYVSIDAGSPQRIDGLCTNCWTATLWTYPIHWLSDTGVSTIATWTACVECWTGQNPSSA